jgi:YihY family inner membrane protein
VRTRRSLGRFFTKAYEDGLTGLASMVAYNLLLSLFALALVALFVAGRLLQSGELEQSVLADLQRIFPTAAASTLTDGIRRLQSSSTTAGVLAVIVSIYAATSFWGALDTAFCRIYHRPCRSWPRQKLFALAMLLVVLGFVVASVAVPTVQGLIVSGARKAPFGLSELRGLVATLTLVAGVLLVFALLCLTYWAVPYGPIPWRCVWPGALGATVAMVVVDYGFPLYLQNVSSLRLGTSFVFALIALVWFYLLAIILLAGAVVNELRFEGRTTALKTG